MDVRHYFNACDFSKVFDINQLGTKYLLGSTVEKHTQKAGVPNLHKIDVAIFGVPGTNGVWESDENNSPDKIRKELYSLANFVGKNNFVDFGNLKETKSQKATYLALRDIVEYLNEFGIVSIILGGSQDLSIGISDAFKSKKFFSFSTVDALLDVKKGVETNNSTNYLTKLFGSNSNLLQFSLIAYQSHYVATELFSKTKGVGNHLRLGLIREAIQSVEPVLRNTDFLSFDISSIKYTEAAGGSLKYPNGLRSEEACQIARYAGISENLNVFGLFEYNSEADPNSLTAKLSAQIVWYFLDGFLERNKEIQHNEDEVTVFKVEVDDIGKPLKFLKNNETNRWWMEIESLNNQKIYIGCSKKEYKMASNNEIPELWLKYVQKIDGLLK